MNPDRFDSPRILRQLAIASRHLGQLNGEIHAIPNESILVSTLGLQESKESSEIENIVTTQDEIYRGDLDSEELLSTAAKEVHRYRQALGVGARLVRTTGLITLNHICEIQSTLIGSQEGIRTLPGTVLRNSQGEVVYTPPQGHDEVLQHLKDLENFINDSSEIDLDPLIKMALIHHQFESIHPFYDGNGRTGRILNILYLLKEDLLSIPVLYLSRPLMQNKAEYYRQLQAVRDHDAWEDWVEFMLRMVISSALDGRLVVMNIKRSLLMTKHLIKQNHKFYSHDLINILFSHPYTKIEHLMKALNVSRITASKYLEALTQSDILTKVKIGRSNYYINHSLWQILARGEQGQTENA